MKRNNKKGFTLTELIIVIVIIGILAAVLIPVLSSYIKKARMATEKEIVRNINMALKSDEVTIASGEKHKTMYDALQVAKSVGYDVAKINDTKYGNEILWDSKNDVFCYLNNGNIEYIPEYPGKDPVGPNEQYLYWSIMDHYDDSKGYSVYLSGNELDDDNIDITTGIDTGENTDIKKITYSRASTDSNQTIRIRTASARTSLEIDDKSTGSIEHYDSCGALNIIQCYSSSYHEFGKVAFAEIKTGRMVLEQNSLISQIHINKTTVNEQDAFVDVIIEDNGAKELPQKITRDEVSISTETLVVKVVSSGIETSVFVYPDGGTGTTEKTITHNSDVESELGLRVLDNGNEKNTYTADDKVNNKDYIVGLAIANEESNYCDHVFENHFVAATCTEKGISFEKCVKCGYESDKIYTERLGHALIGTFCNRCGNPVAFIDDTSTLFTVDSIEDESLRNAIKSINSNTDISNLNFNPSDLEQYLMPVVDLTSDKFKENINDNLLAALEGFAFHDVTYVFNAFNDDNFSFSNKKEYELVLDEQNNSFSFEKHDIISDSYYSELDIKNLFAGWDADFYVSFSEPIRPGTCGLGGSYLEVGSVGFLLPELDDIMENGFIPANTEIPLLKTACEALFGMSVTGLFDYNFMLTTVREFTCGFFNLDEENIRKVFTVKLRITKPSDYNTPINKYVDDSIDVVKIDYPIGEPKDYNIAIMEFATIVLNNLNN